MTTPLNASAEHRSLSELAGNWSVVQKQWLEPDGEPIINTGVYVCRVLMGGLAVIQTTELEGRLGRYTGLGIATWNIRQQRYETAWIDNLSQNGFVMLEGKADRSISKNVHSASGEPATQERVWNTRPLEADFVGPAGRDLAAKAVIGGDKGVIPMSLVENRISQDSWVAEFYVKTDDGPMLVMQNEFTRRSSAPESLHESVLSSFAPGSFNR